MFRIFNKSRAAIEPWENKMLRDSLSLIFGSQDSLVRQIDEGLLNRILPSTKIINNYIGFSYKKGISKKYIKEKEAGFVLKGIRIFDTVNLDFFDLNIYVIENLIVGYSTSAKKFKPDLNKIDVSNYRKVPLINSEFKKIEKLFTKDELSMINPDNVFEITIEGKVYFHLKDIGDGDFLAVDDNKKFYKISHNPFNIIEIQGNLSQIFERTIN